MARWAPQMEPELFSIERGVRQGDVLSSLLFNAALEAVFVKWKQRLGEHGWHIGNHTENLTNTRYADDVLLYAKSLRELQEMLQLLHDELRRVGLEMHESKTKVLTSVHVSQNTLSVRGLSVEILPVDASHKYLGKLLCLDATSRLDTAFNHRLGVAWGKFNSLRRWLVNRHIPMKLRLKLFESTVQPTALFGLVALPLGSRNLERLAATQRKMLRNIVGWVRHAEDDWHATMSRMKQKMERAEQSHKLVPWDELLSRQQAKFALHLRDSKCEWPRRVAAWSPVGARPRARPRLRWDDAINKRCPPNWIMCSRTDLLNSLA